MSIETHGLNQTSSEIRKKIQKSIFPVIKGFTNSLGNKNGVVEAVLSQSMAAAEPIQVVGFWGAGEKAELNEADETWLQQIADFQQGVKKIYAPGLKVVMMLSDEHVKFNHKSAAAIDYLNRIGTALEDREISHILLSDIYHNMGLQIPNIHDPINHYSEAWKVYLKGEKWFLQSAQRHNNSGVNPEQVAYHYVDMRLRERNIFSQLFPQHIVLVNASKELGQLVMPSDAPIMYKNGTPAWFR